MTIRKQGSATGRVLGVEQTEPESQPAPGEEQEPEETLVDRPLQGGQAPPELDGDDD